MNIPSEKSSLVDFQPMSSINELKTEDRREGTGDTVQPSDTITVHYTGALAQNGQIFQSSHDLGGQPITFPLNGVIEGWQKGVPGMKVGGTRRLYIPAVQAYGAVSPDPTIPANSDLVFDIELLSIQK
jgi:FKBP-type peptidyl-prolyl cis-trans isomerase